MSYLRHFPASECQNLSRFPKLSSYLFAILIATFLLSIEASAEITFTAEEINSKDASSSAIVSGDFNNDGILDLVTVNEGTISFYKGLGNGKYAAPVSSSGGGNYAAAADFNGDGKLDLAITAGYDGTMIYLGNGDGTFSYFTSMSEEGWIARNIVLADFNGDHIPDIAIDNCGAEEYGCGIQVYLGKGDGTFTASATLNPAGGQLVAGDFNADGHQDIAVLVTPSQQGIFGLAVFLGKGNGQFESPLSLNLSIGIEGLAVGDFYDDRIQTLAITGALPEGTTSEKGYIQTVQYSNGKLVGSTPQVILTQTDQNLWLNVFGGDINGDFKDDIVIAGENGSHSSVPQDFKPLTGYMLGTGKGTFDSLVSMPAYGNYEQGLFIRDLKLNSRHDVGIDWETYGTNEYPDGGGAFVLLNNNAATNCDPPPANKLSVHICAPTSGETIPATYTFRGAGNAFNGIAKRMELWIDGKKVGQNLEDQLNVTTTLTKGTHTASFVVVDSFDAYTPESVTFTVE
jgi:hypothetical protein